MRKTDLHINTSQPGLFSIGHSNVPLDALLSLLGSTHIQVVADVRTVPRSRYVPHFDAKPLATALAGRNIKYVSLGRELGGRPDGDEFYDEDEHVRYDRLAECDVFRVGLDRLLNGAKGYRIALLCSEENPMRCHRHLLIGRVLRGKGINLLHIRADGRIESDIELDASDEQASAQTALFSPTLRERSWRSLRSVSRRRMPLSSSGH
jgi:uncharacterized protein (DUF488 family)